MLQEVRSFADVSVKVLGQIRLQLCSPVLAVIDDHPRLCQYIYIIFCRHQAVRIEILLVGNRYLPDFLQYRLVLVLILVLIVLVLVLNCITAHLTYKDIFLRDIAVIQQDDAVIRHDTEMRDASVFRGGDRDRHLLFALFIKAAQEYIVRIFQIGIEHIISAVGSL